MTALLATIVDWEALGETALAAFISGVGVCLFFSIAILGTARTAEASREGATGQAVVWGALAFVGFAACAAAIAFGIVVMTTA
jgi:hypothetical protein